MVEKKKKSPEKLRLKGNGGLTLEIDISKFAKTQIQKDALTKLAKNNQLTDLSIEEKDSIKNLKYKFKPLRGTTEPIIVRLDWRWFKIDERINSIRKTVPKKAKIKKTKKKK